MPHIHTKPGEYDHTASAFIIRIDGGEPRVLLHKHKIINAYMQIGGHIETYETPWQSITHEILEESGYGLDQLQILQPSMRIESVSDAIVHPQPVCQISHPFKDRNHFHTDTAYAFIATEGPRSAVATGESTEMQFFTLDQLRRLDNDKVIENVREIGIYILNVCLIEWQPVPASSFK